MGLARTLLYPIPWLSPPIVYLTGVKPMQVRQIIAKFAAIAALSAFTLGVAHAADEPAVDQASAPKAEQSK
ncbi:hypothetical protein GCM10007860_33760 [Chitiniphilus shinanonensis]|uniref:Uncharacterized protein n=1 Tax=Chitiniphilus shinanonensis TaxID=553088 RepID=A0ABQ6C0A2_9NEIS|nr:hypothetical protein GCM10007860_33760 [Chitiniphilus shinanonensis]